MNQTMKNLPAESRPYEKCEREGASSLSDSELLAVILRCGTKGVSSVALAGQILGYIGRTGYPGLTGLMHVSVAELSRLNGIGRVKAVQLTCIGELCRRMAASAAKSQLSFQNPATVAQYYMEKLRHEEKEYLYSMFLDGKSHLLGERLLTIGTVNLALISPREVFLEALRCRAVCLILVHNHPSGDPTPSESDLDATEQIFRAGELLGIQLLDHIIIGDQKYVSLREQRLFEELCK